MKKTQLKNALDNLEIEESKSNNVTSNDIEIKEINNSEMSNEESVNELKEDEELEYEIPKQTIQTEKYIPKPKKVFVASTKPSTNLLEDELNRSVIDIAFDRSSKLIDELLAGIPQNQGFYLKLYKEINAGDFQLKIKISDFSDWADLELKLTEIVRQYTKEYGSTWGSGCYKLVIGNENGIRGTKDERNPSNRWKPIYITVDAEESMKQHLSKVPLTNMQHNQQPITASTIDVKDNSTANSELIDMVTKLMETISKMNSSNPENLQKTLADTFKSGADSRATSVNSTQDLIVKLMDSVLDKKKDNLPKESTSDLINSIASLLELKSKNNGHVPSLDDMLLKAVTLIEKIKPKEKERDIEEVLALMSSLDKVYGSKKEDPLDNIGKIADMIQKINSIAELTSKKSSESTWDRVIDHIAPVVPSIINNVINTINNVADVTKIKYLSESNLNEKEKINLLKETINNSSSLEIPKVTTIDKDKTIDIDNNKNDNLNPQISTKQQNINEELNKTMPKYLIEILNYIQSNDKSESTYNKIISTLDVIDKNIIDYVKKELFKEDEMLKLLIIYGGSEFNNDSTKEYVSGFISYVTQSNDKSKTA